MLEAYIQQVHKLWETFFSKPWDAPTLLHWSHHTFMARKMEITHVTSLRDNSAYYYLCLRLFGMSYYEINNPNEWWSTQNAIFIAEELVILCIKISQNCNGINGFGMKITFDNRHKLKSMSNVYRKILQYQIMLQKYYIVLREFLPHYFWLTQL